MFVGKEIEDALAKHGYTLDNVYWIGSRDGHYVMNPNVFMATFGDQMYDSGYGSPELPTDLVMVMKDNSWFERYEYDGSEGWEYQFAPRVDNVHKGFNKIISDIGYQNMKEVQEENGLKAE